MSIFQAVQKKTPPTEPVALPDSTAVHLLIGFQDKPRTNCNLDMAQACALAFCDLTGVAFAPITPDVVVAPLIGTDFDALDLLDRLTTLKYHGRLRLIAPRLPNRQLVLRELRSAALMAGISIELMDAT